MIRGRRLLIATMALACVVGFVPNATRGADAGAELKFTEFYASDFTTDLSDKLKALAGKPVVVRGFMAPPLKADAKFMVLTREPVYLCPYCESDADWPRDTLVVYVRQPRFEFGKAIRIAGTLDVGSKVDESTGFVSLLRLVDAEVVR
jgi:hypothetical protein